MIEFVAENREAFVVLGILLIIYVVANIIVHSATARRKKRTREMQDLYNDIAGGE